MASDPSVALPQSHAAILRDAVYTLIAELGIMRTMRIVPTFQWQPEQETACGVYLRNETASPDGDSNAGEPHFRTTAVIGVSVLVKVEDPALLATATDIYVDPIQRAILTNPDFIAISEGVEGYSRVSSFPPNGSSYMSETRLEMTFSYQERWEPNVPDAYLRTILKTLPLGHADAPVITTVIDQAQG